LYRQVFRSGFIVFTFWWLLLGAVAVYHFNFNIAFALHSSVSVMVLWAIGALSGPIAVITWLILERGTKQKLLMSDSVRGLVSSIGEVPNNAREPVRSVNLPVFEGIPNVASSFYPLWMEHYSKTHPQHVALLKAMLQIYEHNKAMPATHVRGGHGGRTLLQHSLLVAYQMQNIAMKWEYTGLRDKSGKKVLVKLRNEGYKFDPLDPLVVLTGLAHDIGKIEAFIYDGAELVGSRHEHDLTGARMLARLPEMWDIPDTDRQAILLAIAHYHHPMELPLAPDRHAIDDRTIALMELLIKADFTASAIERHNQVPTESDYDKEMDQRQEREITDDVIWESLIALIEETGRINSPDRNYNVGTVCQVKGQNSTRLVLHETSLRGAITQRLGISETKRGGDSRDELTVKILELLDKHNVLVKTFQGATYEAGSALWRVGFFGKKSGKGKSEVEYITGWPAAIIVMPTISKYVESLPSYHWVADIERGTMGKARAKKGQTEQSQEETQQQVPPADAPVVAPERIVEPVATAEVAVVETAQAVEETPSRSEWAPLDEENPFKHPPKQQGAAQRQPQKGRGATNSTRVDLAGLQGVRDQMEGKSPSVPQNVSPEGSAAVGGGDTAPVAAEPILSRFIVPVSKQHGPKQIDEISPYLLKKAIAKTLRIEPMPTSPGGNGEMFYIMSTLALVKHVPEINWAAVSADIIGLAKTERGKGFIATEEGGQLYLCVDCMMMKSFMDGEDADQREH
jgi:hypothetical protein